MIAFLDGVIAQIEEDALVISVGGVGYRVSVPTYMAQNAEIGMERRLYTYQHVREDALLLFGFMADEDRKLFVRLQSASGVGPKLALQILSHLRAAEVVLALRKEDLATLVKVPGVGSKTAQRMVLELKDRLDDLGSLTAETAATGEPRLNKQKKSGDKLPEGLRDLQTALTSLGYNERETTPVLLELEEELLQQDLTDGLKRTLRTLGR